MKYSTEVSKVYLIDEKFTDQLLLLLLLLLTLCNTVLRTVLCTLYSVL